MRPAVRRWVVALLGAVLSSCSAPNPAGAKLVVFPDPIKMLILVRGESPATPPCCNTVIADFILHITANGLMSVERVDLRVTRKTDGAVHTSTLEGRQVGFQATRLAAGDRHRWELPMHIAAPFDAANEGREFAVRIDVRLLLKTGEVDLTLEPRMIEG